MGHMLTDDQINRQIATLAARNFYFHGCFVPYGSTEEKALMAEAAAVDRHWCSDEQMLRLLRNELARVRGQSLGGYVSAAIRRTAKRAAG